jgi:hypothetical protein
MCAVSAVGDYYTRRLPETPYWPGIQPHLGQAVGGVLMPVSRLEFDALKKDVEELKKLLLAAKKFDDETGQPDCEVESKVALIKKLADLVGVSMEEVFGK